MKRKVPRLLVLALLVGLLFFFSRLHLGNYATLESLKAHQRHLHQWYQHRPVPMLAIFFLIYIVITGASIPGATILTLAGGALFGLFAGTIAVSFASSLGATLAFMISRFLLRDFTRGRFRTLSRAVDEGIRREGAFYLFALRLIPVFPFFAVNTAMGLTEMPIVTFFIVSQIGMLPGTIVYVNAGNQLGHLTSLRGILSPSLLCSFALLGLLPLLGRRGIEWARRRRTLRRYRRPARFDYNVVVIGAGSAGLVSALIAAAVRAKVALIEKHKMGGDCLNTGCVPSKALIRSAKILAEAKRAAEMGFRKINVELDFAEVMERVQRVIHRVEPHDSIERYRQLGVDCFQGQARVRSPYEIEVNGRCLTSRNLILASGAEPVVPRLPGLNQMVYFTTDTIWSLRQLPRRLVVLGGGPVGCELSQCFARFGSRVIQIERGKQLLPREDRDASQMICDRFTSEGIDVKLGHTAISVHRENEKKFLLCESGQEKVAIEFDELLLALGRRARVDGFGLEELGIRLTEQGTIAADEFLRTNYPNLFVCGDVAGPFQFTHTASHQAWYAAVNSLFGPYRMFKADYRVVPWATFTDPEIARVGLNETEALEKGIPYEVTRYGIDDLDRAIADGDDLGFVKILTEPGRDRILGATIVGSRASDIIVEYIAAMKNGTGLNKILGTIHIYPTHGEANKYAAGVWKRSHAPQAALPWLEKFHGWRRGERRIPM